MHLNLPRILILLFCLCAVFLPAQQRVEPVINLTIEPVNPYTDAVRGVAVVDSVLYFALNPSLADSVYASDGSAPGTRAIGSSGENGAQVLYGFGHAGDYYYVTEHYLNGIALRRANYADDRDEAVATLAGDERPEGYQALSLGDNRTLLVLNQTDSLRLYLLDAAHAFRQVTAISRTDGLSTSGIAEAYAYAPDSVRLTLYESFPTLRSVYRLALGDGNLTLASRTAPFNEAQGDFTVGGLLFAGAQTPAGAVVHVYAPNGRMLDSLNFGTAGFPKFTDRPTVVGDDIYFSIRRDFHAELYRYRGGEAPERVSTDAAGEFLLLAPAPGPLGASTPYVLVREANERTGIYLLENGALGRKVATVASSGVGYPSIAGVTGEGILFRIPQSDSPESLFFTNGRADDSGYLSELNGTEPFAFVDLDVLATDSFVYFIAAGDDEDLELYRTVADGTQLTRLTNVNRPGSSQTIFGLRSFQGGIVFRAAGPQDNTEWWIVPSHGSTAH